MSTIDSNHGVVTLSGAINAKDKFWCERSGDTWNIRVGPLVQRAMDRVHAQLIDFEFDSERNHGRATVKLPLVGRIHVILRRTSSK